jgi:hypothetical protein
MSLYTIYIPMDDDELMNLMATHSKSGDKRDIMKLLIPLDIRQETSLSPKSSHKLINKKFKGEIVLDVIIYNGTTYYKDKNNNLLNEKTDLVGFDHNNEICLYKDNVNRVIQFEIKKLN